MNIIFSFIRRGGFKEISISNPVLFAVLIAVSLFFNINIETNRVYAQNEARSFAGIKDSTLDMKGLSIFPPKAIGVIYDQEHFRFFTYSNTVQEVLSENNIEYSKYDIISPNLESEITIISVITIDSIEKKLQETVTAIPFTTEIINDPERNYGTREIIQKGIDGVKIETYKKLYLDEELLSNELYSTEIVQEPIKEIVKVGAKKGPLSGGKCPHWYSAIDNITADKHERSILKFLIRCESGCNAGANNSNTYLGLLQFNINTFLSYSNNGDVWDGGQQIRAALKILRNGGLEHHWPHCSNKFLKELKEKEG